MSYIAAHEFPEVIATAWEKKRQISRYSRLRDRLKMKRKVQELAFLVNEEEGMKGVGDKTTLVIKLNT